MADTVLSLLAADTRESREAAAQLASKQIVRDNPIPSPAECDAQMRELEAADNAPALAAVQSWWNCSSEAVALVRENRTLTLCMRAAKIALAHASKPTRETDSARFVNVGATVMQGSESVASCRSVTMAKRIAAALNWYKPGRRGA
jgi:hypothetical protein